MPPSMNCTVPVGEVVFGEGVTVAVKSTFCPMSDGLIDETTSVVVEACAILKDCSTFVAALKLPSPLCDAVTVQDPAPLM